MMAAFRNEKKSNNADHNGDNEKQEGTVTGVHINCKQSQCTLCVKGFARITLCRAQLMSEVFFVKKRLKLRLQSQTKFTLLM